MKLGIDRGAVYTKAVLFENNKILKSWVFGSDILLKYCLDKIFKDCLEIGINKIQLATVNLQIPGVSKIDPFTALKKGVLYLHPSARSIIEVGGERVRFLKIGEKGETELFSLSEKCASGTGLFIEQQAKRLHISVEEFVKLALDAERPAKIAGRCAVFAKSDMIHLQQKGVPVEEIAYGLCYSVGVNIISTVLKGQDLSSPSVLAGGCAKNLALIRGLKELLGDIELIPSLNPGFECALGACLENSLNETDIREIIHNFKLIDSNESLRLPPLRKISKERLKEPEETYEEEKEGYVGIDVGSVSTDIVVIDPEGSLLSSVYLPTKGAPVEVLVEGFKIIKNRFKGGLRVLGSCATGSGRYLAKALCGVDIAKNEITSQMRGTLFYFPDADTIFEIGGQDSKYIYIEEKNLKDFTMNKICAAGTGSFIEEQTSIMGIDVKKDFSNIASGSKAPCPISSQCTVFMERNVSSGIAKGESLENLCAGIAYSIVDNYIEKVVQNKNIGEKIVFQGGVASNDAVVSAFETKLGREIYIHPYNRISGAIGAALIARENVKGKSTFRFPEKLPEKIKTFECRHCSNFCDVSVIKIKEKEFAFFGDTCERYTSKESKKTGSQNLAHRFNREVETYFNSYESDGAKKIGIPRTSVLLPHLPFWATFFKELNYLPVLSSPSSKNTLIESSKLLRAVTCIPIKFTAGHIASLMDKVDFIFLPSLYSYGGDNYTCPYTQSLPSMLREIPNLISPTISMEDEEKFLEGFSPYLKVLNVRKSKILSAYRKALEVQRAFENKMKEETKWVLEGAKNPVAVIGRPYNIFDPYLNLNLFSHIKRLGFEPVPMNLFDINDKEKPKFLWKYPNDGYKIIKFCLEEKNLYPIILSNYGCGLDAFSHKVFEDELNDFPSLFLEFDEHRGEAGLITRLEAFKDLLDEKEKRTQREPEFQTQLLTGEAQLKVLRNKKIYIPYFADHAYALSGALKYAGMNAEVLPPPEERIMQKGECLSSGKECHAYSIILGDLADLIEKEKKDFIYFFPGTRIPCLLNQYHTGMNLFLKKEGLSEKAFVYTPASGELIEILGMKGAEQYYISLFAIDLLHKIMCLKRPFEKKRGETIGLYNECLKEIEVATEKGEIFKAFSECVKKFRKVACEEKSIPFVGVSGDIYTRVNRSANFDLFNELAERGIVGIPSPFQIDIVDFGISRNFYRGWKEGEIKNSIISALFLVRKKIELKKFYREIEDIIGKWKEPDSFKDLQRLTKGYTDNFHNELFYLNVAKMKDFAEKGVDGIINAICFNCMVGVASSGIVEKIRDNYKIPVITLVYTGQRDPDINALLDAFAEEVKERRKYSYTQEASLNPFFKRT